MSQNTFCLNAVDILSCKSAICYNGPDE